MVEKIRLIQLFDLFLNLKQMSLGYTKIEYSF